MLYNIFLTKFNGKIALFCKKIWIFQKKILYLHREKFKFSVWTLNLSLTNILITR